MLQREDDVAEQWTLYRGEWMKKIMFIILAIIVLILISFVPFEQPRIVEMEDNETEGTSNPPQIPEEDLSETYPQHPTIENCWKTVKRDFCIGDVAEFTNNINLCYEILDPDIKAFCIARISLNEPMCMEIKDEGLREACLESIHIKESWSS